MAKREISIVLKAKNELQAGLAKAGAQLKSFGVGVLSVGKSLALSFAGGTAALAATMAKAQEFNKQIGQITTVSNLSFSEASAAVRKLSAEFGLAKEELTKGLYDALSAGIPQENVFDFMATASKTAIAGATTTKEAVDFLTTAINAFKIPASDADKVADTLFQTVKLGKTTVGELASSFAQVGPLASASGVAFEEVMAAAATLTKQGTPTAQAMTQIRAAITAMNDTLGDGWSSTMTLQQGMQKMADMAGGSQVKLKELTGRVEGMNAILGVTGENAQMAASDLDSITNAAGAASEAFGKMGDTAPLDKFQQSLNNVILVLGDNAIKVFGPTVEKWAKALAEFAEKAGNYFERGGVQQVQMFVQGVVYGFELLGNAFKTAAAILRDAYGPPIEYVSSLIAAFVGKAQTDFRALGDTLSYIASSIRRPWEFSMSELTSLFKRHAANTIDAQKELIGALKGEDVKLTNYTAQALAEREQIHASYAEKIQEISNQQLQVMQNNENEKVEIAQQAAAQIVAINEAASDMIVNAKNTELEAVKEAEQSKVEAVKESVEKIEKIQSRGVSRRSTRLPFNIADFTPEQQRQLKKLTAPVIESTGMPRAMADVSGRKISPQGTAASNLKFAAVLAKHYKEVNMQTAAFQQRVQEEQAARMANLEVPLLERIARSQERMEKMQEKLLTWG